MTDYLSKIEEAIRNNWEEQVKTLEELISVRSVDEGPGKYEGKEGPFGPGVQEVQVKSYAYGDSGMERIESTNENVVTAEIQGNTVVVTAHRQGTAIIVVYTKHNVFRITIKVK